MQSFATITQQDVILLTGKRAVVDELWQALYGREVEDRYRPIPYQLIYLIHKYGDFIPHKIFLPSIQEICGETITKPDSNEVVKVPLSVEGGNKYIDEAVMLGLITRVKPRADKRWHNYRMTEDQIRKLYRIRQGESEADGITEAQSCDPKNPNAGETGENRVWCFNIIHRMVNRRDAAYEETKTMLEKLKHLIHVIIPFIFLATIYLLQIVDAAATIAGGSK